MRCGGSQRTVWPGESLAFVLLQSCQCDSRLNILKQIVKAFQLLLHSFDGMKQGE